MDKVGEATLLYDDAIRNSRTRYPDALARDTDVSEARISATLRYTEAAHPLAQRNGRLQLASLSSLCAEKAMQKPFLHPHHMLHLAAL